MTERDDTIRVVERFFTEVWGDPTRPIPKDLIHADYWTSEPGTFHLETSGGTFAPSIKGEEALARELAHYRDFYPDFVLTIREIVAGEASRLGDVASWEADHMRGDVVSVAWNAGATHPTAMGPTRVPGREVPLQVSGRGISLVRVVDGKIFEADKYWERDSDILERMSPDIPASS